MEQARAQEVVRKIEQVLAEKGRLSRFCEVFVGEYGTLTQELLTHLAAAASAVAEGQSPTALGERAGQLYLELYHLGWQKGVLGGNWFVWVVERLLEDNHVFLQQCASNALDCIPTVFAVAMRADLRVLQQVASLEVENWLEEFGYDELAPTRNGEQYAEENRSYPWSLQADTEELHDLLRRMSDWGEAVESIAAYLHKHKHGVFRGCPAFRLAAKSSTVELLPIKHFAYFPLEWLEGNQQRVYLIEQNTLNLLRGYPANNTLIWGPRGGGKSTLIRSLIGRYYSQGLRGIEILPAAYEHLHQLFSIVRGRPECFIGVLDNISMDRHDPGFRYLSRILDGGLEQVPSNLVFYATSNYKDLVDREGERPQGLGHLQMDGDDGGIQPNLVNQGIRPNFYDPQQNERLDEQRALDDRFGLKIFIDMPNKKEYEHMVVSYAKRVGIDIDEDELLAAFNIWRMRHNHDLVGGRTARDFIVSFFPQYTREKAKEPI
jgi:hypothetical protein